MNNHPFQLSILARKHVNAIRQAERRHRLARICQTEQDLRARIAHALHRIANQLERSAGLTMF